MTKEIRSNEIEAKAAIRKNAEDAKDWPYHEYAVLGYELATLFKGEIFQPYLNELGKEVELPPPVISFDNLRNRKTLAAYTLHRNAQGLLDEITFNSVHFTQNEAGKMDFKFSKWAFAEILFHEDLHLLQENFLNAHEPGKVVHDKMFVQLAEKWGVHPTPVKGSHWRVADEDRAFGMIMKRLGFERPDDVPRAEGETPSKNDWFRQTPEKGKSALHKWICPDCGLAVRIGIGSDPHLVHDVCSEIKGEKVFLVRADGQEHTIYRAELEDGKDEEDAPLLINQINTQLQKSATDLDTFTVEAIADSIGINKSVLYEWIEGDAEFTTALRRLIDVQENDPFKTGTAEDAQVNSATLAFLLLEVKDRHFKADTP